MITEYHYRLIKKICEKNKSINLNYNLIKLKLIEEMAELTQTLLKNDEKNTIEECVDVWIVLNQLGFTLDKSEIEKMIDYKLERTKEFLGIKED